MTIKPRKPVYRVRAWREPKIYSEFFGQWLSNREHSIRTIEFRIKKYLGLPSTLK